MASEGAGAAAARKLGLALVLAVAAGCAYHAAPPQVSELAVDGAVSSAMVFQRGRPIHVAGRAAPGAQVRVALAGRGATATADADGGWVAELPALDAGGPYAMTVRSGGQSLTYDDIAIGEVWLCSGQSNMARPVSWLENADDVTAAAANDDLRLLLVETRLAATPVETLSQPLGWRRASPDTVGDFSAVCYLFGQELQATLGVPVGLVASSRGGSPIEAWMPLETIEAMGVFPDAAAQVAAYARDPVTAATRREAALEAWWRDNDPGTASGGYAAQDLAGRDADWPMMTLPSAWAGTELEPFDGAVWFRRAITLPADWDGAAATLSLGTIDDRDTTWINGVEVGATDQYDAARAYAVPAGVLRAGANTIAVRVLDTGGDGGFRGGADSMALTTSDGRVMDLAGPWRYRATLARADAPALPADVLSDHHSPSVLYNGMIAPLRRQAFRGVLWYQGEQNARYPDGYGDLMRGWANAWRATFDDALAFVIIQLPGYNPPTSDDAHGHWPEIREAQRAFVAGDPNAALVVTLDTGNPDDIHPQNKMVVGHRAAQEVLALAYDPAIDPDGPQAVDLIREGGAVRVAFSHAVEGLRTVDGAAPRGFAWCGADGCAPAEARMDGASVVLARPGAGMTELRYAWSDYPDPNLTNAAGLPAEAFRMSLD